MCRQLHRCSVDMQISTQQPRNLKIHYVKSNISSFKSHKFWTWLETVSNYLLANSPKPLQTVWNYVQLPTLFFLKQFQMVSNSFKQFLGSTTYMGDFATSSKPFRTVSNYLLGNSPEPFQTVWSYQTYSKSSTCNSVI